MIDKNTYDKLFGEEQFAPFWWGFSIQGFRSHSTSASRVPVFTEENATMILEYREWFGFKASLDVPLAVKA